MTEHLKVDQGGCAGQDWAGSVKVKAHETTPFSNGIVCFEEQQCLQPGQYYKYPSGVTNMGYIICFSQLCLHNRARSGYQEQTLEHEQQHDSHSAGENGGETSEVRDPSWQVLW